MPAFRYACTIDAPVEQVAAFHFSPGAFRKLAPPLARLQVHRADPLAEGSVFDFTLWMGPVPVRWTAVHSDVDPLRGFTDTQVRGPMDHWVHMHGFAVAGEGATRVTDTVTYAHRAGLRGLASRLLFSRAELRAMFRLRARALQRALREWSPARVDVPRSHT